MNEKEYKVEAEKIKAKIMGLSERKADNFGGSKVAEFLCRKRETIVRMK